MSNITNSIIDIDNWISNVTNSIIDITNSIIIITNSFSDITERNIWRKRKQWPLPFDRKTTEDIEICMNESLGLLMVHNWFAWSGV